MPVWKQNATPGGLNGLNANTLAETLGIRFTAVGDDYLEAVMPVNASTVQPYRVLHGGANVALAETIGSVASMLCLDDLARQKVVGIDINANHLKTVHEGSTVTATCRPVRIGRKIHVWEIHIHDENGELSCISRLTTMVVQRT